MPAQGVKNGKTLRFILMDGPLIWGTPGVGRVAQATMLLNGAAPKDDIFLCLGRAAVTPEKNDQPEDEKRAQSRAEFSTPPLGLDFFLVSIFEKVTAPQKCGKESFGTKQSVSEGGFIAIRNILGNVCNLI